MTVTGYSPEYRKGDLLLGDTGHRYPRYSMILQVDKDRLVLQALAFRNGIFQNGNIYTVKASECMPSDFKRIGRFRTVGIFKDNLDLYCYRTTKHRLIDENDSDNT